MAAKYTWPTEPLSTVIVPAQKATFSVHESTKISAPASAVFSTLLDYPGYSKWCTWAPKGIVLRSQPDGEATSPGVSAFKKGTKFTLGVRMDPSKPTALSSSDLYVTDISTPSQPSTYIPSNVLRRANFTADLSSVYRIAWANEGTISWLIQAERFHEVIVTGERECEVRCWECFKGVTAGLVKMMYQERLKEGFAVWMGDLKREGERRYGEQISS